jgi:uncharacterized protein (TIGR00299 family) protein
MRVAYIQSIGGASGDMLLGALVDLGLPMETLRGGLAKLDIDGYSLEAKEDTRCEVRGTYLKVMLENATRYTPRFLLETVAGSELPDTVKEPASRVLKALWRAEGRVHGQPEEALELEELGSVDTLVDVVGTAIGLHQLEVDHIYASPLVLGSATPPRRPGGYSNPAAATLELMAAAKAPLFPDHAMYQYAGELTTPTGAALITTLATFDRPALIIDRIGVGLGSKNLKEFPNALRVWTGETVDQLPAFRQSGTVLLETNLDDVPGVVLGYTQERLFAMGALDVWCTPIQMKKNRPATILSALMPQELEGDAVELILRETPTLGIRTRTVDRHVADRQSVNVDTELGTISVKVKYLEGVAVSATPEPDECRRIALERGIPFQEVYQRTMEEARRQLVG